MTRLRAPLTVLAAGALLAGCGSSTADAPPTSSLPQTGGGPVVISAEAATCTAVTPGDTGVDCSVLVWYSNGSTAPQQIDLGRTRLVDTAGVVYRGVETDAPAVAPTVGPQARVSARWTITLPVDAALASVTWLDDSGATLTVPVAVVVPTTPTPTRTPTPSPTPTPKPTATKPAPTPTPTRTRTSRPRPTSSAPPATGSIG